MKPTNKKREKKIGKKKKWSIEYWKPEQGSEEGEEKHETRKQTLKMKRKERKKEKGKRHDVKIYRT